MRRDPKSKENNSTPESVLLEIQTMSRLQDINGRDGGGEVYVGIGGGSED